MIKSIGNGPRIAPALIVTFALAACTQTASSPPSPSPAPGVTPNAFRTPDATGCASEVGQFRAVLKNDVDTGNVGQSVFDRASADLARADTACTAGRDGEARALVASTKSRFGYR